MHSTCQHTNSEARIQRYYTYKCALVLCRRLHQYRCWYRYVYQCQLSILMLSIVTCACLGQDCVCLIALFSYNDQVPELFDINQDFDLTGNGTVWYARPQLFFSCMVCPRGHKETAALHMKKAVSGIFQHI